MSDFTNDPTIETTGYSMNPEEGAWNEANMSNPPGEADTLSYTPHQPRYPGRAPTHLRRWLVAGGLVAALGIGGIGGGALALAHATSGNSPNGGVAASTLAHGKGRHRGPAHLGPRAPLTVTAVRGNTITATRPDGAKVTIHTTASTTYSRAGQAVSASALTSGARIRVHGTRNSDGSITAARIDIALPGYAGVVTAVSGNTITVKARNGATRTIDVTASTRYVAGRGPAASSSSLSAIKLGDRIAAEGTLKSDGSLIALVVHVGPARPAGIPRGAPPASGTTTSSLPGEAAPVTPAGI